MTFDLFFYLLCFIAVGLAVVIFALTAVSLHWLFNQTLGLRKRNQVSRQA